MDVRLLDVTSGFAVLPLMGPQARALLQQATADDVSTEALPFGSWREIRIAGAPVRALRVTYVGELGFELHVPTEYALAVYDALVAAGAPFGLAHAGYRAIESLRLEKGYRAWGADIGPDHTPLEAGLGFALKLGGDQPFLGREALERQQRDGLKKRLAGFTVDDPEVVLLGRETIYRDGERVGWLTSGGYGYTVAKAIGYGYVRNPAGVDLDYLRSGRYELEVATERVPAMLHLRPLYDPEMSRVHG
jgi:4-methylaminobutanoate oxidase (formaldehyde-forming)